MTLRRESNPVPKDLDPEVSGSGLSRRMLLSGLPSSLAGLILAQGGAAQAAPTSATIAYPADLTSWDPTARTTPLAAAITACVFDPALRLTPDLKLRDGLAAWRWLDKGARRLQLDFRDDVLFHNGDRLTARDFKFTYFDRLRQDPTLQLAAVWNANLEKVETPSAQRAIMYFRDPMPWAPYLLAEMGEAVIPAEYLQKVGEKGFLDKPVGTGPYRLADYQRNARIVLEAFDRHWAGPAPIKRITLQIMPDATARATAMQAGQADITINLSSRETLRLGGIAGLSSEIAPSTGVYLLHMVNKGPLRDANIRLAAHHAVDKAALSRALFAGRAKPLSMLSPPGAAAHDPNFQFSYDPGQALALMARAGHGPSNPVRIKLFTTNGAYANDFDITRAIVQMWRKIGILADLQVLTLPEYMQLSQAGKLEGPALWNWYTATGSPVIYGYILDPSKIFSVWKSDDVAQRFAGLRQETDYERLTQAYRALEIWAVQQGYTVPLLQATTTVVHKRNLRATAFTNGSFQPYQWRPA